MSVFYGNRLFFGGLLQNKDWRAWVITVYLKQMCAAYVLYYDDRAMAQSRDKYIDHTQVILSSRLKQYGMALLHRFQYCWFVVT